MLGIKRGDQKKIACKYFTQEIPDDGFDAAGNLKKYITIDPVGEINGEASYDELYQLIEEKGVQEHSYKNDSLSNRIKKDTQDYYVDDINRLLTDSIEEYVYDKNGNMIEKRYGDKTVYYTYDALDRLVEVFDGSRMTMYAYDYLHRRIARTANRDDREYFLYLGCREIGLYSPQTNIMKEYRVLGLGKGAEIGASVAIELNQEVYCPIHDYRGDIVCLVNLATQEVDESYRYTGYGECETYDKNQMLVNQSEIGNPWGFSSKRVDVETGFVYFHRRYYSPEVGRWITPDPLGFADGPNLYAYVHNNPLTHFDLYGLLDELSQESESSSNDAQDKSKGSFLSSVGGFLKDFGKRIGSNTVDLLHSAAYLVCSGVHLSKDFVTDPVGTSKSVADAAGRMIGNTVEYLSSPGQILDSAKEYFQNNGLGNIAGDVAFQLVNPGKFFKALNAAGKAIAVGSKIASKLVRPTKATKSSLKQGREMHRRYKVEEVANDKKNRGKEVCLPDGKRVDYIDKKVQEISELKPNNPEAIAKGLEQLNGYLETAEKAYGGKWMGHLDVYDAEGNIYRYGSL